MVSLWQPGNVLPLLLCLTLLASTLLGAAAAAAVDLVEPDVKAFYGSFDTPVLANVTFEEVRDLLLRGKPLVVQDGARGLEMSKWTCDFVRESFPNSRIRQEGGRSDVNGVKMSSDWTSSQSQFPAAAGFPEGAPKNRPFYWDIAKAYQDEPERKWGKDPGQVVKKLVAASAVPYFLPKQSPRRMGASSEMWFHPPGAGAPAHMDPHCETTVSFCFSGQRRWRMMVPPAEPHQQGYFDGHVYGANDPSRKGEWQPTFEFDAPEGSAVVVYPGMVHETRSTGSVCSSSISQTFQLPVAAAYYRAFWPRFSLIHEDVGRCGFLVEEMVTLGSGRSVPAAKPKKARAAAEEFAGSVDADADGAISEAEIRQVNRGRSRMLEELVSFHDVDADGQVTKAELVDSWLMYAAAQHRVQVRLKRQQRGEL